MFSCRKHEYSSACHLHIEKKILKKNRNASWWDSVWSQCLWWQRNSSWRILQKKCDLYCFMLRHMWLSESPRSIKIFLSSPVWNNLSLSFNGLEEKKRKENLLLNILKMWRHIYWIDYGIYEKLSGQHLRINPKYLRLHSWAKFTSKITGHFHERLYFPTSLCYASGNCFWGRKSFQ